MDSDATAPMKSSVAYTSGKTPPGKVAAKKTVIENAATATSTEVTANETFEKVAATTTAEESTDKPTSILPKKRRSMLDELLGDKKSNIKTGINSCKRTINAASADGGGGSLFESSFPNIVFSDVLPFCDPLDWVSIISTSHTYATAFKLRSGVPDFWINAIRTHFLTSHKDYEPLFPPESTFIYWDDSYDSPDGETTYTFKPALRWSDGPRKVVTSPVHDLLRHVCSATADKSVGGSTGQAAEVEMYRGLFETMLELNRVISKVGLLGGESDAFPHMIALPWNPDEEVTPVGVLEALGAHPELIIGVCRDDDTILSQFEGEGECANEDDLAAAKLYHATMSRYEDAGSRFKFEAGYQKLNPFPLFELASFCGRRLVMGVVTEIVST